MHIVLFYLCNIQKQNKTITLKVRIVVTFKEGDSD